MKRTRRATYAGMGDAAHREQLTPARVAILVAGGSDINDPSQSFARTALHWAAFHADRPLVQALLGAGAAIEARDSCADTPLAIATWSTHPGPTEERLGVLVDLLEHGADPDVRNERGTTPLEKAMVTGTFGRTTGFAAVLLAYGADPTPVIGHHRLEAGWQHLQRLPLDHPWRSPGMRHRTASGLAKALVAGGEAGTWAARRLAELAASGPTSAS